MSEPLTLPDALEQLDALRRYTAVRDQAMLDLARRTDMVEALANDIRYGGAGPGDVRQAYVLCCRGCSGVRVLLAPNGTVDTRETVLARAGWIEGDCGARCPRCLL